MKKWLNIFLGVLLLIVNTEAFAAKKSKKPELKLAKLEAQQSYTSKSTYKFTRYTGLDGKMGGNLNIKPLVPRGTNVVYQGFNAGKVKYVGITSRNPALRFGEHLNSIGTGKELLNYRVIDGATNLTRTQARVWKQALTNQYGLGKNGGQLLNKINSIAPKNWWKYGIK